MKFQTSGFVMIDALLAFVIAGMIVSLLSSASVTMMKQRLLKQEREQQRMEWEEQWWQNSNGGCRDTCLIDELAYPWR